MSVLRKILSRHLVRAGLHKGIILTQPMGRPPCRPPRFRGLLPTLAAFVSLTLAGCSNPVSILAPKSSAASEIASLFWILFWAGAVIFVVVDGLLIYSIWRFQSRSGQPEPRQVHGSLRLEIAWTIAPAIILVGVFLVMVPTMSSVLQPQPDALRVKVTGHQWWWEIEYPDQRIITASDLRVPVGRPVEVELISADVIHSFWVPELAGKTDAIPGQTTLVRFTADKPGEYRGQCAEFCGVQHANMGFLVIAETEEQFEEWVEHSREPEETRDGDLFRRGTRTFLDSGCGGCHAISGTQAQGRLGPNLTDFGSRKSIASLTLDNTPENLAAWLKNPQAIKAESKMPDLRLISEKIAELVEYLESLK